MPVPNQKILSLFPSSPLPARRKSIGLFIVALCLGALAHPARAVDHDNVDANRPLDFDDAETIAYREKSVEFGGALTFRKGASLGVGGEAEYLVGFARNWQLNVGLDPQYAGANRRLDAGDLEIGVQHNFNRETESSPAFGVRADAILPTGRGARGIDLRLRGIASRKFGRYGRLHLNTDLSVNNRARDDERSLVPGLILGYSVPLGFPTRFDRTLLAQIGVRSAPEKSGDALVNIGIGLRQQVTPRSVLDVGVKSDIAGSSDREKLRLIAGYSTAF